MPVVPLGTQLPVNHDDSGGESRSGPAVARFQVPVTGVTPGPGADRRDGATGTGTQVSGGGGRASHTSQPECQWHGPGRGPGAASAHHARGSGLLAQPGVSSTSRELLPVPLAVAASALPCGWARDPVPMCSCTSASLSASSSSSKVQGICGYVTVLVHQP